MNEKELAELTDQELLEKAKKMKSASTLSALVIGIMVGVIIFSIVKSSVEFFTLIPLFFIYKIVKGSQDDEALKNILKERNLI